MNRRIVALFLGITMVFSISLSTAYAVEDGDNDKENRSYQGVLPVIPDEDTPFHISYGGFAPAVPLNQTLRRADGPMYYWASNIGSFSGSCYSESWNSDKTQKYRIDQILASVSVYKYGIHEGNDIDIQYNSYTAKASFSGDGLSAVVEREAYGTHKFTHSGYETMEEESYASA